MVKYEKKIILDVKDHNKVDTWANVKDNRARVWSMGAKTTYIVYHRSA